MPFNKLLIIAVNKHEVEIIKVNIELFENQKYPENELSEILSINAAFIEMDEAEKRPDNINRL
ncbi:MAG: hypothetical protein JXB00_15525 [Bacteroidales bacterium]|nr:hypothetical protein [Bacteroidales bacterium]